MISHAEMGFMNIQYSHNIPPISHTFPIQSHYAPFSSIILLAIHL